MYSNTLKGKKNGKQQFTSNQSTNSEFYNSPLNCFKQQITSLNLLTTTS